MSSKKFNGKYRIESVRLKNYDYSLDGAYFITIVIKNREHYFGKIVRGKMVLNNIGQIVQQFWDEIPQHFPFIKLGAMVIMPNHIHGVLWIDKSLVLSSTVAVVDGRGVACNASTMDENINEKMANISPKRGSLATVIRSFKSAVTRKSRKILPDFAWQPRFHDRIIRDENEMNRIREYIIQNPAMWERNRNNQGIWL